ncbi:MAG: BlaI/MecI/CopY family transcriptional regulator [Oscillospiraceae bacterium]|nr:BlaI/MecI/CopY family transcriptional regulator [Oscillospiraceae bacterium]
MVKEKDAAKLSERERDVMTVLWRSDKALIASEIVKASEDLTINSVQAVLKALLAKKAIEVADIVYSGTVLTRSYRAKLKAEDYVNRQIKSYFHLSGGKLSLAGLLSNLIDEDQEREEKKRILDELEEFIKRESAKVELEEVSANSKV